MADINDLTTDIYTVLNAELKHEPNADLAAEYSMRIGGEMAKATLQRNAPREKGKLWASDLGKPCMRQHWYNFNMPEVKAPLLGHTKFKFLYGNILEEAVLYMAEEAGHEVTDQQARVEWDVPSQAHEGEWQVTGRIDAFLDGCLVDVKSTSVYGFARYKHGIDASNDSFGYLFQLGFYAEFGEWGFTPEDKGFVWIDKQNGHIKFTSVVTPSHTKIVKRTHDIIDSVESAKADDVNRGYAPEPYGKSGNQCLPMSCSYCSYKNECWKDSNGGRGLRTFAYNHKPIHFTTIAREPKVPEIFGDA